MEQKDVLDVEAINRIEENQAKLSEDQAWFESHPEREFRIRRAYDCEISGTVPAGYAAFVIVHRQEIEQYWKHHFFGRRQNFNTDLTDAEIRELL